MTLKQTGEIMDILAAAYPQFGRQLADEDKAGTTKLWAAMFMDDDLAVVAAAVKALIATKEDNWPPPIGAVKARIRLITSPPAMTGQEAWACVAKAIKNSAYESRDEFSKLPAVAQSVVCSPEQLKEWSQMEPDVVQSVVSSNFMRSYRERARHEKEIAALPSDVRAILLQTTGSLMLEGDQIKFSSPLNPVTKKTSRAHAEAAP